jgi:hypothetical protein
MLLGLDPALGPDPVSATHLTAPSPFGAGARGSDVLTTSITPASTALTSLVSWIGIAGVTIGIGIGAGFLARPYVHARLERTQQSFVTTTPNIAAAAEPRSTDAVAETPAAPAEAAATLPLPPPRAPNGKLGITAQPVLDHGLEVQLVDRARMALREGNAASCLQHLDERKRRVGGGMLGPEATLLRVQALLALDRRAAALSEAQGYLRMFPEGPIAERLNSVLAKSTATTSAL